MKIMSGHDGDFVDFADRERGQHAAELGDLLLVVPAGPLAARAAVLVHML
jgi:hypothetical protein